MACINWREVIKEKKVKLSHLTQKIKELQKSKIRKDKLNYFKKIYAITENELDKLILAELYEKQNVNKQNTNNPLKHIIESITYDIQKNKNNKNMTSSYVDKSKNTKNKIIRNNPTNNNPIKNNPIKNNSIKNNPTKNNPIKNDPPKFASSMIALTKSSQNKFPSKITQSRNISAKITDKTSISNIGILRTSIGVRTLI
jgi:hypothetical protein